MASDFYVGVIFGALSRTGIILGYKVDDQNRVEAHLGGFMHISSLGLSLKRYNKPGGKDYLLFGYTTITKYPVVSEPDEVHGINVGYGRRTSSYEGNWSSYVEIGGGIGYDFNRKEKAPLFFVGYGENYKEN